MIVKKASDGDEMGICSGHTEEPVVYTNYELSRVYDMFYGMSSNLVNCDIVHDHFCRLPYILTFELRYSKWTYEKEIVGNT